MRTFRTLLVVVLALSALFVPTGCGCGREVAATVNGEKIYVDEVEAEIEAIRADYPQMFEGVDGDARVTDFRRRVLENLVVTLLVSQAAEEQGITVSETDIDEAVAEMRAQFPDEASFQSQLDAVGMTEEDVREQIRDSLLSQAMIESVSGDVEVAEADVEAYYNDNLERFTQQAAKRASHILFALEDAETAQRVLDDIRAGADFGQLARQYSIDDATKEQGGDLGWPSTPYVAEFQAALDDLEVGDVSDLVETVFGWHIITVLEDREETVKTLDEAREEIVLILKQQEQAEAYQQYINDLRAAADIEYFVDYAPSSQASEEATSGQ